MTKQRTMDPLLLIGSIILLAAILTWVLPAGRFERRTDPHTGRTMVVPGSYTSAPQKPGGPWGALVSIPQGWLKPVRWCFLFSWREGRLPLSKRRGAIGNLLNHLMSRFGDRPLLVLALTSILFLIGGASNHMYERSSPFFPCCVP